MEVEREIKKNRQHGLREILGRGGEESESAAQAGPSAAETAGPE